MHERLGSLIQNVADFAVLVVEPAGSIVYCNRGSERLLGYPAGELLELDLSRLCRAATAESGRVDRLLERAAAGESAADYMSITRKEGPALHTLVTAVALRNEESRLEGFLLVFRDDREQRSVKEKIRERERMAAIGTAAAMLAHQIKNPLNGISTTVQLLERSLGRGQAREETLAAAVRDLKDELDRLQALVGDFQTISEPSRLNLEPVDLGELGHEVAALSTAKCEPAKIEIVVEREPDLPPIDGDSERLKKALVNLVHNACEAMPHGGTLTIKTYRRGNEIRLDVTDTGPGIPEGLDVFDLFTSTKPGGTGLGLVIVKQVVVAHGGTVTYVTEKGKGTTFTLAFPVAIGALREKLTER
ncbi:MAG TPA: ATP-binding protein [Candidatus Eisenbacteria bacterium]|nr:ATP-binding protein [Candidatus Eisenbacteria bacterium]